MSAPAMTSGAPASQVQTEAAADTEEAGWAQAERRCDTAPDRQRVAGDGREKDGRENGQDAVRRTPRGAPHGNEHDRDERQETQAGEQRSRHEPQPVACIAPVQREPARRQRRRRGSRQLLRRCRAGRSGSRGRARARVGGRASTRRRWRRSGARRAPAARTEGASRRARPSRHRMRREGRVGHGAGRARGTPRARPSVSIRVARACGLRPAFRSSAARSDALGRFLGSMASAVSTAVTSRRGRPRRSDASGGAPAWIARATSWIGMPQNGCRSGEGLPEEDADGPHVALRCRLAAGEALRSDVRERAGNVSDGRQRVRAVELGEAEVEQAHGDLVPILEEDVRGLDVAMNDPGAVGVCERVEDLGCSFDCILIGERTGANRIAHRSSGDVLVGDVDVPGVVPDVVRAHAAVVTKAACGERLALRARGCLPFARDDLRARRRDRSARRARARPSPIRRFREAERAGSARGRAPG